MSANGPSSERELFMSIIKNPSTAEKKRLIGEMPKDQQGRFSQFYKQVMAAKKLQELKAQETTLLSEREELLRERASFISSQSTQVASSLDQIKAPAATTGADKKKTIHRF